MFQEIENSYRQHIYRVIAHPSIELFIYTHRRHICRRCAARQRGISRSSTQRIIFLLFNIENWPYSTVWWWIMLMWRVDYSALLVACRSHSFQSLWPWLLCVYVVFSIIKDSYHILILMQFFVLSSAREGRIFLFSFTRRRGSTFERWFLLVCNRFFALVLCRLTRRNSAAAAVNGEQKKIWED